MQGAINIDTPMKYIIIHRQTYYIRNRKRSLLREYKNIKSIPEKWIRSKSQNQSEKAISHELLLQINPLL